MKKTYSIIFLLLCSAICSAQLKMNFSRESPSMKMQIAEQAIAALYVDSVDEKKLVEDGIRGMLEKLDPHSQYSTPQEVKAFTEPLQGNFDGIGVQFNMVEDTLVVIQTITNGPSEKVGIMAGDRITAVNDTAIAGVKMSKELIMQKLRGKKGTKVDVSIVRRGIKDTLRFTITRDKIPVYSINASYMIRPGVGYIRIESFGANTHKEFVEAAKKLKAEGMKDIIVDLQENGGGYMQSAIDISNEFLDNGDMIVYANGRQYKDAEYHADGNGILRDGKVVVLVNEYSASASEIVSGAIQDQDRGVIVGRRTFGKGLVQRPIELPDGSMIRLTVAHYYTPSGRCIQKPYEKGNKKDYSMDVVNRLKKGELMNADSIHFADSLKYYTLKKHRLVYGGGGVMPDYFIPLDTTLYTPFHREISAKSIIISQSIKYVDKNRKKIKSQYKDIDDFILGYDVPQEYIDEIISAAEKADIRPKDSAELEQTLPQLKLQLKALVARDIWDMTAYFRIVNESSEAVKKALQLID